MGLLSAEEAPAEDDEFLDEEFDDLGMGMGDDMGLDEDMPMGGAFESYADTAFNPEATPEERSAALRSAIETILEEQAGAGPVDALVPEDL